MFSQRASVAEQLRVTGKLNVRAFPAGEAGILCQLRNLEKYGGDVDMLSMSVAMVIWSRVHGIVSLEIANNLPPFGAKGDALYLFELESIARQFIKE